MQALLRPTLWRTLFRRFLCIVIQVAGVLFGLSAQNPACGCLDCPKSIPDNRTTTYNIQVQRATNGRLGTNGQGLCGVRLRFEHPFIGDLEVVLTSPSGQRIILIGRSNCFTCGRTPGTAWDVTFVGCNQQARPDFGLPSRWDNAAAWGIKTGEPYRGSYRPYQGCLDTLTGSVNGEWKLTVTDSNPDDMGRLLDYQLTFCDQTGVSCANCAADAGNLLHPNITACNGSARLRFQDKPVYPAGRTAPPSNLYGYTYIVSNTQGVIIGYDSIADFRLYPEGSYTVCGLSYLRQQQAMLPTANNLLTIIDLRAQLNSPIPPFCGHITDNCVQINITPGIGVTPPTPLGGQGLVRCHGTESPFYVFGTSGTTFFQWSIEGDGQIIRGQGTEEIAVRWQTTRPISTANVCVSVGSACDTFARQCTSVQVSRRPSKPIAIIGDSIACSGIPIRYIVPLVPGAVKYNWSATKGQAIGHDGDKQVVVWSFGDSGSARICVAAGNDDCGYGDTLCLDIQQANPVTRLPSVASIAGTTSFCAKSRALYSIPVIVPNATSYEWLIRGGCVIRGQGTSDVEVEWADTTAASICVAGVNSCGRGPETCIPITIGRPINANAGVDKALCGVADTLRARLSNAANTGQWSLINGPGTATFVNPTAPVTGINVSTNGLYMLRWTETAIGCSNSDTVVYRFNSSPTTSLAQYTCDNVNENYTLSFNVTGGTAPYQANTGSVQNGVFSTAPLVNGFTHNIVITDANGCRSTPVTGTRICSCTSNAGALPTTALRACVGERVTIRPTQNPVLDANDTGIFVLHTGTATTIGNIITQNTTGVFEFQTGMTVGTTYQIAYVVGNRQNNSVNLQDRCLSIASGQTVTFNQAPRANAGVDNAVCGAADTLRARLSNAANTGQWSLINGPGTATFVNPTAPVTGINVSTNGLYVLRWTETANGCNNSDTVVYRFNGSPTTSLAQYTCDNVNENYTLSFNVTGGTAPYRTNTGSVQNGVFSTAPLVNGFSHNIIITDANGCRSAPVTGTRICSCTSNAGALPTTALRACVGERVTIRPTQNPVLDANDTGIFVLHTGTATTIGNIITQNTTGVFEFQTGMTVGTTYQIAYVVGNRQNNSVNLQDRCLSIASGQTVTFNQAPRANAGVDNAVCGAADTLRARLSNAANTGQWSLINGPGTATFVNPTAPVTGINVSTNGLYVLRWTETANGCSSADTIGVRFNSIPSTGPAQYACDNVNENYSLSFTITGGTAPYQANGGTVQNSVFTTSTPLVNGFNHNVVVVDANGCRTAPVTGTRVCACTSRAGTLPTTAFRACTGERVTVQHIENPTLDPNDVGIFVLHTGTPIALGNVVAQNNTGIFEFQPGMTTGTTYQVAFLAGNGTNNTINLQDRCLSVAYGPTITFNQAPRANVDPTAETCGQSITLPNNGNGRWTASAGIRFNATQTQATSDRFGPQTLTWTVTDSGCSSSSQMVVTFNSLPAVVRTPQATCTATRNGYTVSLGVNGGTAPYTLSGIQGTWNGGTFTSASLTNASNYTATVVDAKGCTVIVPQGTADCSCRTNAGTMSAAPLELCAGQTARGIWNRNANLDTNDVVLFVLHDAPGTRIGQVISTSTQPNFDWNATSMTTGKTYYISAVAGDRQGTSINFNEPCLSVVAGTPVRWRPLPRATLTGSTAICMGDTARLSIQATGSHTMVVRYAGSPVPGTFVVLENGVPIVVPVTPTATNGYRLLNVSYADNPGCTTNLTDSVTVRVSRPANIGFALPAPAFCNRDTLFLLKNLIRAVDTGGVWSVVTPVNAATTLNANSGQLRIVDLPAGLYRFRYRVTPAAPCPVRDVEASIRLLPVPIADAGIDQTLSCTRQSVTLGGTSTTNNQRYVWEKDGRRLPNANTSPTLKADTAGRYSLIVTNAEGCSASDVVQVGGSFTLPQPLRIAVQAVRCFGENNGRITITPSPNANQPLQYSLNDGPLSVNSMFPGLPPGLYTVNIEDPEGCKWTSAPQRVTEPSPLSVSLGPDQQIGLGDSVRLQASIFAEPGRVRRIEWTPLVQPQANNRPAQSLRPLESGNFSVRIVDTNGCTANASVRLLVRRDRDWYVPNVFAPESGGTNAQLTFYGSRGMERVELFQIFDRWGALVFKVTDVAPGDQSAIWDGRYNGQLAPPGVFTWVATVLWVDGKRESYGGTVTVLR
jgi:subtilisin-like proprotein convertase family protein